MIPLQITTDFPCSNAQNIRRLSDTAFRLDCRPDAAGNIAGSNYAATDYYYAFRVRNDNPFPADAVFEIITRMYEMTGNTKFCHRTAATRPVLPGAEPDVTGWSVVPPEYESIVPEKSMAVLSLTVPADTVLDVTDMYWYSYDEAEKRLFALAGTYPQLHLRSLGRTPQGRDIWAAELSSGAGGRGIIAATPQCSECGTLAVMGMLEKTLSGEVKTGESRPLSFIPVSNPDGNILGSCMTNALNENIVFGYQNDPMPAECRAVWDYVHEAPTAFFLEMHSYHHQDRPSFRSYEFDPILYPDTASRARGMRFLDAIKRVSPSRTAYLALESSLERNFRASIVGRLVREGIPATLYKLHNRETPLDNIAHAARLLESILAEKL